MDRSDEHRIYRSGRRIVVLIGAAIGLALLAAAPYLTSLHHPLLHDDRTLLASDWLREEANVSSVWSHDYWYGTRHAGSDLYRPLTILGLAWNVRAAPTASGIRSVNLLCHGLAVLVAWWALTQVFRRSEDSAERARNTAWIGAALFAVHPLASETVLFAVGRAESLGAALALAGLAIGLQGQRAGSAALVLASALPFALALCAKESAAAWLAILGAWILLALGRGDSPRLPGIQLGSWAVAFASFLFLRGGVVGWSTAPPFWVDNPLVTLDPVTRAGNALLLLVRYVGKMVWPARLGVHYEFDQLPLLGTWAAVTAGLLITILWIGLARVMRERSPAAAFLWCALPAAFAVTGNFVLPIGTIFAERLAYLPLVFFCGLVAVTLRRLPRLALAPLLILLVVALAVRGEVRSRDLRSKEAFVEAGARSSPRAVKALANLGRTRLRLGKIEEAQPPLEAAVMLWPEYPRALGLLADLYRARGDTATESTFRRRADEAAERLRSGQAFPPSR